MGRYIKLISEGHKIEVTVEGFWNQTFHILADGKEIASGAALNQVTHSFTIGEGSRRDGTGDYELHLRFSNKRLRYLISLRKDGKVIHEEDE